MTPRILVIDDKEENRYMLESLFRGAGMEPILAANGAEGLRKAKDAVPDLIISDILMPVMDGFELCRRCKADPRLARVPFVIYTATYTDSKDEAFALGLGADRFIVKPQEADPLIETIRETLASAKAEGTPEPAGMDGEAEFEKKHGERIFSKLEKKMAELEEANRLLSAEIAGREKAEATARKLALAIDGSPVPIVFCGPDGSIEYANKRYIAASGLEADRIIGMKARFLEKEFVQDNPVKDPLSVLAAGTIWRGELTVMKPDDSSLIESVTAYPAMGENGHLSSIIAIIEDITEKRKIEEHLRRTQRLEELGKLAGGVAHDFNNILTVVTGFADLTLGDPNLAPRTRQHIQEIVKAGERAQALTGTLLSFSRKQESAFQRIDLNRVLREFEPFLKRIIRNGIMLDIDRSVGEVPALGDKGQLEQVVMNLVTNARDAMPEGGKIEIIAGRAEKGGKYALLEVRDSGIGMDERTKNRIFEPFFTTKLEGKGTGLGLALVYGIVEQHRGFIEVESSPGKGSIFRVYIPLSEETIPGIA